MRASFRWLAVIPLVLVTALALVRFAADLRENDPRIPPDLRLVATPLGRVAIDERGPRTGRTVLIVPGTAGWSGFWREITAHLSAHGFHVVAVDLPPFGYSDRPADARYDRDSQAARLAAVLAATAREPAIIVAHSFGAGAATELALDRPDRVARLVLVDAALGALDPELPGGSALLASPTLAQPLVAATLANPHAILPLSRAMLARKDAAARWRETVRTPMRRPGTTPGYAAWLPSLFVRDDGASSRRTAALAAMHPPVRLIWGEADTVTPIAQGLVLADLFRAPIARLPGVGHVPHIEDPPAFLAALDRAVVDD